MNPTAKICSITTCHMAGQFQPLDQFYRAGCRLDGQPIRTSACITCTLAIVKSKRGQRMRECVGCRRRKPVSDFDKHSMGIHVRRVCKACMDENECERREEDRRRVSGTCRELTGVDVVPCSRCGLRGHEAGDPEKCLHPRDPSAGLGVQWW